MSQSNIIKVPYPNILLNNDGIYVSNEGKQEKVSNKIWISSIRTNIDTNEVKAKIKYIGINSENELELERDEYLNPTNLMRFQKYGLDIMKNNSNIITQHLRNEEDRANKEFCHSRLGFDNYKGKEIYKLYNCVGIDSKYSGNMEMKPKGERDKWIQMFNEEVLGHAPLEFAIILGLSSVILGYIGEELGLDTTIVHLEGNSTTGKSTAVKLAISLFGYPDVKKDGLFSTYNATGNALIKQLTGIEGVPFAFDEISISKINNFTDTIYKFANGTDKARLNKDSELSQKDSWLTTILSTGERSLIESANKNAGIQIRVIEISNLTWTKDAKNAEKINQVILENYGHLGIEFAQLVIEKGRKHIKELYERHKGMLNIAFDREQVKDNFTDRRIKKLAILLTTMKLFEELVGVKMQRNEILDILIDVEKESIKNRNFNKSAMDYIIQYVSSNKSKFTQIARLRGHSPTPKYNSTNSWGRLIEKDEHIELEILTDHFDNMIKEGGFESSRTVLKELKSTGELDCEADRYTRERKTDVGVRTKVYVIKIPK